MPRGCFPVWAARGSPGGCSSGRSLRPSRPRLTLASTRFRPPGFARSYTPEEQPPGLSLAHFFEDASCPSGSARMGVAVALRLFAESNSWWASGTGPRAAEVASGTGLRAAEVASGTGPRAAEVASGTGPRAAERPRLWRGAFGTRGPVPFHSSRATKPTHCGVHQLGRLGGSANA
jgi:hypothetical protein